MTEKRLPVFHRNNEEALVQAHPEGELNRRKSSRRKPSPAWIPSAAKIRCEVGAGSNGEQLGLRAVLHRIPQDEWAVRQMGRGLSAPLHSGNAPDKRDLLGTLVLSVLAGQWRYAHISAIRADGVNPALLGMARVASEIPVQRSTLTMDEAASGQWLKEHLKASYGRCCRTLGIR